MDTIGIQQRNLIPKWIRFQILFVEAYDDGGTPLDEHQESNL